MTKKRFTNSEIISSAQSKIPRASDDISRMFDMSFAKKDKTQIPKQQTDESLDIQKLQITKKQLKEEIEHLRKIKRSVEKQPEQTESPVKKNQIPRTPIPALPAILLVCALAVIGGYLLDLGPAGKTGEIYLAANMPKLSLTAFTDEELLELKDIYLDQQQSFTDEYAAIDTKLERVERALNTDSLLFSQGQDVLKNNIFVEYQYRLGIMELQHILFKPSSEEVAAGLKKGVNSLKNEMVASLKQSIEGGFETDAQEEVTTLINKMFLDSRKNVIDTLRLTASKQQGAL